VHTCVSLRAWYLSISLSLCHAAAARVQLPSSVTRKQTNKQASKQTNKQTHNTTQYNTAQHNTIQHNTKQHKTTQNNAKQHTTKQTKHTIAINHIIMHFYLPIILLLHFPKKVLRYLAMVLWSSAICGFFHRSSPRFPWRAFFLVPRSLGFTLTRLWSRSNVYSRSVFLEPHRIITDHELIPVHLHMYIYMCVYLVIYLFIHLCMYVSMYLCIYLPIHI
jgi:cation transport ATPase